MDDSIINLVVFGVVSWTTLFILTRIVFPNRSFDFCNRIVSTVHATLIVILASLSVQDWRCPISPSGSRSTTKQMRAIAVSVAYLIYDFVCCLFDKQVKFDNIIHHLVSAVGLGAGLFYEWCGSELVAALWLTELSSPFLHLREILKELGYKDTDINLAADVLFAVIFSCARMIGGPYLTYVTISADNPIIIKAMSLGLQLVSAFWFYKIARMVMYKFSRRSRAKIAPSNFLPRHLYWSKFDQTFPIKQEAKRIDRTRSSQIDGATAKSRWSFRSLISSLTAFERVKLRQHEEIISVKRVSKHVQSSFGTSSNKACLTQGKVETVTRKSR